MKTSGVPTTYLDIAMRSKLEASFAARLDELCITWDYEPERFVAADGWDYLPDFVLPSALPRLPAAIRIVEVKPKSVLGDRRQMRYQAWRMEAVLAHRVDAELFIYAPELAENEHNGWMYTRPEARWVRAHCELRSADCYSPGTIWGYDVGVLS